MADERVRPVALVTGGSRGIGAMTALALAARSVSVAITYRNKAARAEKVIAQIKQQGGAALATACDITKATDLDQLFATLAAWRPTLDLLILNASGGMEREALATDPHYPTHINHDAQLALVDRALPILRAGATIVFVTSHWAYLYGQVPQLPAYEDVASSKQAGEQALRARQAELAARGVRLLVVTGDLIEGTITPKLLERTSPGLAAHRHETIGRLPTAQDMGQAIAYAALDNSLATGATVVVGGSLESMKDMLPG